eukprot:TRINITY_DN757_c0_g1_i3.p1 TRINITY_DN757_c0_g1~~TRINITY_DN757_c0_g1_i3.p1  ORF type:complete len:1533 (-),score=248.89 TRINITY_DN757_c0_g1_i3:102-4700(-)
MRGLHLAQTLFPLNQYLRLVLPKIRKKSFWNNGVNPKPQSVIIDNNGLIIFGCTEGYLIYFKPGNTLDSSGTWKKLGAWTQNYAIYNPTKRTTIFVSDSGIVSEVSYISSSDTLTLSGIYLEPDTSFTGAILDASKQVLFVSGVLGSNTTVFRVQLATWSRVASLNVGTTTAIGQLGTGFISSNNLFYTSSNGIIRVVRMFDCTQSDCTTCALDSTYCGFCQSSRTCTDSGSCSANDWMQTGYTCPTLDSITPSRGTADGGTSVNVLSSYLLNGQVISASDVRCEFVNIATVPAQSVTYNSVTCVTPSLSSQQNRVVEVRIRYRNGYWAPNSVSFEYYTCTAVSSCSSCTSDIYPDCGWCYATASCSSRPGCTADWYQQCPSMTISPDSTGLFSAKTVTITVSPVVSSAVSSYTVNFGAGSVMSATRVSSTQLTVTTPVISQTTFNNARGSNLELKTSVTVLAGANTYAKSSSNAFMFYDCTVYDTDCASCTDAYATRARKQDCTFCFDTASCVFTANKTSSCSTTGSCPRIASVTPPTFHILNRDTTTLVVNGKFSFSGLAGNWNCSWNVPVGATPTLESPVSTVVNATQITCTVPSSLTVGTHQLSIWDNNNNRITPDFAIEIYDCSETQCGTCLNTQRPECFWCQSSISCGTTGVTCTTPTNAVGQCPTLTMAAPSSVSIIGDEVVFLEGTFRFSEATISSVACVFVQNTSFTVTAANYTNTGITCISPAGTYHSGTNDTFVYIAVNGKKYTNAIPFEFYDCTQVKGNCLECLSVARPMCKWCATGSCGFSCQSEVNTCPSLSYVEPDHGYIGGGETVVVYGGPFPSKGDSGEDLIYSCVFSTVAGPGIPSDDGNSLTCTTPLRGNLIGNVSLTVNVGAQPYIPWDSLNFLFYDCLTLSDRSCSDQCLQQKFCGWCATRASCRPRTECAGPSDIFLDRCFAVTPSQSDFQLGVVENITITVDPPLSSNEQLLALLTGTTNSSDPITTKRDIMSLLQSSSNAFYCSFEGVSPVLAQPSDDFTSLQCELPKVAVEGQLDFTVDFSSTPLTTPQPFIFVDCQSVTTCDACLAKTGCGWCNVDAVQSCSVATQCTGQFTSDSCAGAFSLAGVVAGSIVGALVLAGAIVFAVLFIRYQRKKRQGLLVQIREPDYEQVAYQGDLSLQYKIDARDSYKELEEILLNRDKTFLSTIFAVTAPTETDPVAKACVYLAHSRGTAAELIQFFATQEVMSSATENTLFRMNSVSSKMFKFYSKLVGTKYLYFTLALVINELNTVAQNAAEAAEKLNNDDDKKASLLNFEMEVDPSKIKDANIDIDQNVFQLAAACQKIFSVIKTGSEKVPMEFRQIFQRISYSIMDKYGSDDAVMKAVSGLLFLRFITPALTAPHYYGLLPSPPNTVAQRQLVLIGKVLQNLANMTTLGAKEQFMTNFEDFMQRNIPKMRQLYAVLLDPATPFNQKMKLELAVPENVRLNSLAMMHTHIVRNEAKIRTALQSLPDEERAQAMTGMLNDLLVRYGEPPKKGKDKSNLEASKG